MEKRKAGQYTVAADTGQELPVKVLYNFLDPIPKVKIGDGNLVLAEPLKWYEYLWIRAAQLTATAQL